MATATAPTKQQNNSVDTRRKIHSPLRAVSGYIRMYVCLEGAALALLFLGIWFWVGLALDYGLFATEINLWGQVIAAHFDWIKQLDQNLIDPSKAYLVRACLLLLLLIGIGTIVTVKILRRFFTEFNDQTLALLLEKRYPTRLGGRLITAVEMTNPELSEKYGYSQQMVDHTVQEATNRLEGLPVSPVFNWGRLYNQWGFAILSTVGTYLLLLLACSVIGAIRTPQDRFAGVTKGAQEVNRVSWIWTKRNVLMWNKTYWPTRTYLEIVRVRWGDDPKSDQSVLRVPRDQTRPDAAVQVYEWVKYDPTTRESIRPLRVSDLDGHISTEAQKALDDLREELAPEKWGEWLFSVRAVDPRITDEMLKGITLDQTVTDPVTKEPKTVRVPWTTSGITTGEVLAELETLDTEEMFGEEVSKEINKELALDWRTWTYDQLVQQLKYLETEDPDPDNPEEKKPKKAKLQLEKMGAWEKFETIKAAVKKLTSSYWTNWEFRYLKSPENTVFDFTDGTVSARRFHRVELGNVAFLDLNDLPDDAKDGTFSVWADNFYSPTYQLEFVPPPTLTGVYADTMEPAYMFYYLKSKWQDDSLQKAFDAAKDMFGKLQVGSEVEKLAAEEAEVFWNGKSIEKDIQEAFNAIKVRNFHTARRLINRAAEAAVAAADVLSQSTENKLVQATRNAFLDFQKDAEALRRELHKFPIQTTRQDQLAGERQFVRRNFGKDEDIRTLGVPTGSSLELVGTVERPLKENSVQIVGIDEQIEDPKIKGALVPKAIPKIDWFDGRTFRVEIKNITQPYEFYVLFSDIDNVSGRQHFLIKPVDDLTPEEATPVLLDAVLRKPRVEGGNANAPEGFLVTYNAAIPFTGVLEDDHGLNDLAWLYKVRPIDLKLTVRSQNAFESQKQKEDEKKEKPLDPIAWEYTQRALTGLGNTPIGVMPQTWIAPTYWTALVGLLDQRQRMELTRFQDMLASIEASKSLTLPEIQKYSRFEAKKGTLSNGKRLSRMNFYKPFRMRDGANKFKLPQFDIGNDPFDVGQIPRRGSILKKEKVVKDRMGKTQTIRYHWQLTLQIAAVDNNVETGPNVVSSRNVFKFLIVSEAELNAQIILEEEDLRSQLETAARQLKAARIRLTEQVKKIDTLSLDNLNPLREVDVQIEEARKEFSDAVERVQKVRGAYDKIRDEMYINRFKQARQDQIRFRILRPLDETMDPPLPPDPNRQDPVPARFPATGSDLTSLWNRVAPDAEKLRAPKGLSKALKQQILNNVSAYKDLAVQTKDNIENLRNQLIAVIDQIGGGIDEPKLIALLEELAVSQGEAASRIQQAQKQLEADLLKELQKQLGGLE